MKRHSVAGKKYPVNRSRFLKINIRDFVRGLIFSGFSSFIMALQELIQNNFVFFTWEEFRPVMGAALSSIIGYLFTKLFSNSEGRIFKKEHDDSTTN